ncbi:MAG: cytochrome B, partial [Acidobacteriota bacterium]
MCPERPNVGKFWKNAGAYFEARVRWSGLLEFGQKKKVPEHKYSFWYYFGGICLFLFALQV